MKALLFVSKHICVCVFLRQCQCIFLWIYPLEQVQVTSPVKTIPRATQFCQMLSNSRHWLSNGTADVHYAPSLLHGRLSCLSNSRATMVYMECTWGKMKLMVVYFKILCYELWWFKLCFPTCLCIVQQGWDRRFGSRRRPSLAIPSCYSEPSGFTSSILLVESFIPQWFWFQNCAVALKKSKCSVHFSSSFSVNILAKPGCGVCVGVVAKCYILTAVAVQVIWR